MISSEEKAIRLLRQWKADTTPLEMHFAVSGIALDALGVVVASDPDTEVVELLNRSSEFRLNFTRRRRGLTFRYTVEKPRWLAITFPRGIGLVLREKK